MWIEFTVQCCRLHSGADDRLRVRVVFCGSRCTSGALDPSRESLGTRRTLWDWNSMGGVGGGGGTHWDSSPTLGRVGGGCISRISGCNIWMDDAQINKTPFTDELTVYWVIWTIQQTRNTDNFHVDITKLDHSGPLMSSSLSRAKRELNNYIWIR